MSDEASKPLASGFSGWLGAGLGIALLLVALITLAVWVFLPTESQTSESKQLSPITSKQPPSPIAPQGGKQFNF